MMVTYELDLARFEAWSGAVRTLDTLKEHDAVETFEQIIEELYPDGMTETQINDILWFEPEWVYHVCGLEIEGYEYED